MASVSLRPMKSEDRGFIIMSFVRSYGRSAYAAGVPATVLIELLDPILIAWQTTIAEAPDGELLGWICASKDGGGVAWLHVKTEFRRRGLGKALLLHAVGPRALDRGRYYDTPFMPTKALDGGTSFHAFVKARGLTVRFRPYLPLAEVARLAGAPG